MLTKTRRGLAATAIAAAALTGVAACGSSSSSSNSGSDTPQGTVRNALTSYQDGNALTVTVKLDASADDIKRLAASGDDPTNLTDAQAKAYANGTIVFAVKTKDKSFKDAQNDPDLTHSSFAFAVSTGNDKIVEFRFVDSTFFARADVKTIAQLGGNDVGDIQSEADQLSSQLPFLKAALAGNWLKTSYNDLNSIAKIAGGGGGLPSANPAQSQAFIKALLNVFDKDVTATKADDNSDLGDHYVVSGSSRTIATDLVAALKQEFAGLPGASDAFKDADPTQVPDKTVKVDTYIKSGKVHAVKLDVAQFATGKDAAALGGKPFYVEFDFDSSADISAPSGATDIDLPSLVGKLGAGLGTSNQAS